MLIKRNSWRRVLLYSLCGLLVVAVFAYFFYRSVWAMIFLLPISFEIMFYLDNTICEKNKQILKKQFREMILSMATNLKVGYSPENAFLEAYADLIQLYGKNSRIIYELDTIKKGLSVNLTLEKLLRDFEKRSHIEEISEFVDVFCLAKKTGGNLVEIIDSSSNMISKKISVDEEIEVITRAGKMERQIMMIIPFLIILYIEFTNQNFFTPLYHNLAGVLVMSVCLTVYFVSVKVSGKIISIRI